MTPLFIRACSMMDPLGVVLYWRRNSLSAHSQLTDVTVPPLLEDVSITHVCDRLLTVSASDTLISRALSHVVEAAVYFMCPAAAWQQTAVDGREGASEGGGRVKG